MPVRFPTVMASLFFAVCLMFVSSPLRAEVRVSLIDGRAIKADAVSIAPSGDVKVAGETESLTIGDLDRIELSAIKPVEAKVIIDLVGGGRLRGAATIIADDACIVETAFGGKLSIPLEAVRALRFQPAIKDEAFEAAVAKPSADSDRLFIQVGDQRQSLGGLIESLDPKQVQFEWQGKQRSVPISQFYGVALAQAPEAAEPPPLTLELVEGSTIIGQLVAFTSDELQIKLAGTRLSVPTRAIGRLVFRSDRVEQLSKWEDIAATENTIVAFPRKFQRDQNVLGKPLTLAGKTYESGIGVHANSRLKFDLEGNFDQFVAVIGVDSLTQGKGDCQFRVELDGVEVYSKRLTGGDTPAQLRLDVADARELSLIVEAGANLDLADVANWADAKLIRPAR